MPKLICTARRIGDYESRTEEYELSYTVGGKARKTTQVKYQAARAYEINAALDSALETARECIFEAAPNIASQPNDGAITQFTWRAMQSVKYDEGAEKTSELSL